jgi:hypothetical protein
MPLEQIALDLVVMDGEPHEKPTVIGAPPDAENFVQSVVPELASYRWGLMKLDL